MKKRDFLTVMWLAVVLTLSFASGAGEPAGTAAPAGAGTSKTAVGSKVPPGFYNLADFEKLAGARITRFTEPPMLAQRVASGELPPLQQRLPETILVMKTLGGIGEYGGTLRHSEFNTDQDWHLRTVNNFNLIETPASSAYDSQTGVFGVPMHPGVLESFSMSKDGLVFTGKLRAGLKWSDGVPVTTNDISFAVNDIFLNTELYPTPPSWLKWGGKETRLEILDTYSFRFVFGSPYGAFIEIELKSWPANFTNIMYPKHYLSRYHRKYAKEADLLTEMAAVEYQTIDEWPEFFGGKLGIFEVDYFKLDNGRQFPTLRPWVAVEDLGNGNMLYERNPFYPIVDEAGNQLPYVDYLRRNYVSDEEVLNMSIISGQNDVIGVTLSIDNYPLYKEHEADGNYTVMPLNNPLDQLQIYIFNMYLEDPALRSVYGDVRFRRAMSVALDRKTMNESLFLGLGRPAQVAPRPGTPFFKKSFEEAWAQYDPALAKSLLDQMGMKDRDGDGWRERPDGKPFTMRYEYFVISGASTPGSELAKRYWENVGIKIDLKQIDAGYYWDSLWPNNQHEATCWWLGGSGAALSTPFFLGFLISTPKWYDLFSKVNTDEEQEVRNRMPPWAQEMVDTYLALWSEPDQAKQNELGTRIWELQAEYLPCIGVATDSKTPLVVSKDMGNVEMAQKMGYNYITVMEFAEQWYFKTPDRRK